MGLFSKNKKDSQPANYKSLTLSEFYSGVADTPSALKNPVVSSIVSIICNSVANLPIQVKQVTSTGTVSGGFTVESKILSERPNRYQTPFTFYQTIVHQMLTRGEAFVVKNRNKDGLTELVPYVESVSIELSNGFKVYTLQNGKRLTDTEVIHILHNSTNGITAVNPFEQHRETINLDNTLRRYAKKYFQNSANPSMYVQVDGAKDQKELDQMTTGFEGSFASVENSGKIPFVPKSVELKSIPSNAKEAMLIESLKYSLETICRIFDIPPSKIGSKEGSNYNSLEAENIAYLTNTIAPIVKKIESALDLGLFYETPFFVKFNSSAILRSTTKERYEAYRIALSGQAFATQNEIRKLEDWNALEGGDTLYKMLNTEDVLALDPPAKTPANRVPAKRAKAKTKTQGTE